jgi:beta-ureidopropionase
MYYRRSLQLPALDKNLQCELKGYKLGGAEPEQLRNPRIIRVGVIQHKLVLPTTEPVADQRNAIHDKVGKYIEHAAKCGANVVCMQELWSKF